MTKEDRLEQLCYKYYVVELLQAPYHECDRYVFVLNKWVTRRATPGGVDSVKFPIEELAETRARVRKGQYSEDWVDFHADVKYGTDSYKDASDYAKMLNKIAAQEQSHAIVAEKRQHVAQDNIKIKLQRDSKTNQYHATSSVPSSEVVTSQPAQLPAQTQGQGTAVNAGPPSAGTRYFTRYSQRQSAANTNTQRDPTPANTCEADYKHDNVSTNTSELANRLLILKVLKITFSEDAMERFQKLLADLENDQKVLENMRLSLANNCNVLRKLIALGNEINRNPDVHNVDYAFETLQGGTKELETQIGNIIINDKLQELDKNTAVQREGEIQNEEDEEIYISDGEDYVNYDKPSKLRMKPREFTYPPEYDPNDSRWTLRHRDMAEGLVELTPYSRVYIDADILRLSKKSAKDYRTFTRMLLLDIFTENALSICSFSGKIANVLKNVEGSKPRPALDQMAVNVLKSYVEDYAIEKGWLSKQMANDRLLTNTIRNKLQDMRNKFSKNK